MKRLIIMLSAMIMLCACGSNEGQLTEGELRRAERIAESDATISEIKDAIDRIDGSIDEILDELEKMFIDDEDCTSTVDSESPKASEHDLYNDHIQIDNDILMWAAYAIDTYFGSFEYGYRSISHIYGSEYNVLEHTDSGYTDFIGVIIDSDGIRVKGMTTNFEWITISTEYYIPEWFTAKYWNFN